jgi:hypothetical protein
VGDGLASQVLTFREENMGLMERLRNAEQHGRTAAREALERARELGEDAQRRIRQRMRIYPHTQAAAAGEAPSVSQGQSEAVAAPSRGAEDLPRGEGEAEEPIVSVNGRDVDASQSDSEAA